MKIREGGDRHVSPVRGRNMTKGRLIIIEAGDGCGKATQTQELYRRLHDEGKEVRKITFPDYQSPSSALIKMYLGGEFGAKAEDVNAFAASAFYAVDRFASYKKDWGAFYQRGGIIIADRYVTSNMAHQAVKITDAVSREEFLNWLWDLEFVKFGLPVPDLVLFLDLPPSCSRELRLQRAQKEARDDIHESDETYLTACYEAYCRIADKYGWTKIACAKDGTLRSIAEIHADVYRQVATLLNESS